MPGFRPHSDASGSWKHYPLTFTQSPGFFSKRAVPCVQSKPHPPSELSRMFGSLMRPTTPNSKFREIPLHLLSMILTELDCMQSLGAAILSHPLLYAAFSDDTKHIVQCILRNQISPRLMRYAAAAFESNFVNNSNEEQVGTFLGTVFQGWSRAKNGAPFDQWCLEGMFDHFSSGEGIRSIFAETYNIVEYADLDGSAIASIFSKTHAIVDEFSIRCLSERLRRRSGNKRLSEKTLFRFGRAMYLLQIYSNIAFHHTSEFHPDRSTKRMRSSYLELYFFKPFSPRVNEQLSYVHHYMKEVLSQALDEIAARGIKWGAESVDWLAQGRLNEHKQAYVGLHVDVKLRLRRLTCQSSSYMAYHFFSSLSKALHTSNASNCLS